MSLENNLSSRLTQLHFRKADILELFNISASEYNDLTRERPVPKKNKKVIFDAPVEFDNSPFFIPLDEPRRGSGYNYVLTVPDLMILDVLVTFRRNGFDRSLGKFIRELVIRSKNNPRIPTEEQVWTEWFGGPWKNRKTRTPDEKWALNLLLSDNGHQELQMIKGSEVFDFIRLFMDRDIGLIALPSQKSKPFFPLRMTLNIDLEFSNSVLAQLVRDPALRGNRTSKKR